MIHKDDVQRLKELASREMDKARIEAERGGQFEYSEWVEPIDKITMHIEAQPLTTDGYYVNADDEVFAMEHPVSQSM